MLSNNSFSTDQLRMKIIVTVMAAMIFFLPIFKGGNYPGIMPLFIFFTGIVFLLSLPELSYQRDKYWLIVWVVFTVSVLLHAFLYPVFFVNERFFIDGLDPKIGEELNSLQLSKVRMVEVWSFFTSMWLFAWRVALLQLKDMRVLLLVLFIASLFQALYGLIHFVSGASSVLGLWTKEYYLYDATGTFVNRNHFSGMLAISSPLVLSGLLMSKPFILPSLPQGYRVALSLFYLMVLVLALVSSHSRMGVVAAIFGLTVCCFLMNVGRSPVLQKANKLKFLLIVLFLFLFAIWFGVEDILQRYADLEVGNSRLDVWRAMFSKLPFDVWLFGVGPGSFEEVFQLIKPSNFVVRFSYAHNDYLEFVFEFGLLLSFFILCAVFLWIKQLRSRLVGFNGLNAGVYGAFAAIALHSVVDFNLQIPASALCFWFAVGVMANSAIVEELESSLSESRNQMKKTSRRFPRNKREWLAFLRSD